MKNPMGHEFEYRTINPRMIRFDELYQRPLDVRRVEKIVKEFNGDLFNEPKVSFRDGVYWCFNGQHSTVAWLKKYGDKPMPVKVYRGLTWLDECELFVLQNGLSKDPTTNEKLAAAYNAKRQDVVEMVRGAEAAGYRVCFKLTKSTRTIAAVSALFKAYHMLGYQTYTDMLKVIAAAWPCDEDAIRAQIISALALIYRAYAGSFTDDNLIQSLKRKTPNEFIIYAKPRSAKEIARGIVVEYNKRRTGSRRLDVDRL